MYKFILLFTSLLVMTACSDNNSDKVKVDNVENPLQGHVDAMDKARNVENVLQDADTRQRELVEQQQK